MNNFESTPRIRGLILCLPILLWECRIFESTPRIRGLILSLPRTVVPAYRTSNQRLELEDWYYSQLRIGQTLMYFESTPRIRGLIHDVKVRRSHPPWIFESTPRIRGLIRSQLPVRRAHPPSSNQRLELEDWYLGVSKLIECRMTASNQRLELEDWYFSTELPISIERSVFESTPRIRGLIPTPTDGGFLSTGSSNQRLELEDWYHIHAGHSLSTVIFESTPRIRGLIPTASSTTACSTVLRINASN